MQIEINGVMLTAFIDTGSELTLIKTTAVKNLSQIKLRRSNRALIGVSGKTLEVSSEVDLKFIVRTGIHCQHRVCCVTDLSFPGEVLIGMDLLRRFNFKLVNYNFPREESYLLLQGVKFPMTYTDHASLRVTAIAEVSNVQETSPCDPVEELSVHQTTTCPPRAGMFVKTRVPATFKSKIALVSGIHDVLVTPHSLISINNNFAQVWVVNPDNCPRVLKSGTKIAACFEVEDEDEELETTSTMEPVQDTNLEGWEDSEFDRHYGMYDFGYTSEEFMIFPELDPPFDAACAATTNQPSSCQFQSQLGHLGQGETVKLQSLLAAFPNLFSGDKSDIGTVPNIRHRIVTTTDTPVRTRQWRLPHSMQKVIREECDKMLSAGVIEPSSSPWLSPVVLVRKSDGTIRFCIDFRNLNKVTVADSYPLPRMDQLLDDLGGTAYFTVLDSRSAYWAVEVEPEDRPKTAFTDGHRLYHFNRLPFGLATAPSTFQRTMNMILASVLGKHTLAYLDDIVVYSKSFDEHLQHLEETLTLLSKAGMKLNLSKCSFAQKSIKFLGFQVSGEGILPDPEKVTAITTMPAPATVKEVRRFLGAVGFFRRHIKDFSAIAHPLTKLTRKDQDFHWGPGEKGAFEALKEALVTAPALRLPDYDRPFEIHTDASKLALGAVLLQRDNKGNPFAVAYYSRKFQQAESNYPPIDQEALAVVEGVRVFDPYVYGKKFKIFTDHRPLTYVFSRKTKSPRMSRYSHDLSYYDYQLIYKKGSQNNVPDLLSRAVATVDLAKVDPDSVRTAQEQDPLWREIIHYLEEEKLPRRKLPLPIAEFELCQGALYHIRQLPDRVIHQLVIPRSLRQQALKMAHGPPLAAHPGIYRTYMNLRNMFYFPNMLREVKKYVQSCDVCQRRSSLRPRNARMQGQPLAKLPLEHVSADLIDLRGSATGHRYVLSLIDHHSRYLQLVPLRNKEADTVAKAFIDHFVTLFGPPRTLQSDQGGEFLNNLFREVCHIIQTRTAYTTAFHPQANGVIERSNRVVKDALASLVASRPSRWPDYLPQVRLTINSAIHRSTGEQPMYLLLGRHGHFPVGLTNHATHNDQGTFAERLTHARKIAMETAERARQGWARHYDKTVRKTFSPAVGDLVLRRNQDKRSPISKGLRDHWIGPCRVVQKIGPVVFMVTDLQSPYKLTRCHVNQLKAYVPNLELEFAEMDNVEAGGGQNWIPEDQPDAPDPADPLDTLSMAYDE